MSLVSAQNQLFARVNREGAKRDFLRAYIENLIALKFMALGAAKSLL
jgi:hypothetical protein